MVAFLCYLCEAGVLVFYRTSALVFIELWVGLRLEIGSERTGKGFI